VRVIAWVLFACGIVAAEAVAFVDFLATLSDVSDQTWVRLVSVIALAEAMVIPFGCALALLTRRWARLWAASIGIVVLALAPAAGLSTRWRPAPSTAPARGM
jgi:hypothetical protein